MNSLFLSPSIFVVRPATERDQQAIHSIVRSEHLNPNGLHWENFIIAIDAHGLAGAVQMREHRDGSRELASLVVRPDARGNCIATRMIDRLLARHSGRVSMITDGKFAAHYARWGFAPIAPAAAPRSVRRNYCIGRLARVISFFKGLPPKKLVILDSQRPASRFIESVKREAG